MNTNQKGHALWRRASGLVLRCFLWTGLLTKRLKIVLAPEGPEKLARCKRVCERSAWSLCNTDRALAGRWITDHQGSCSFNAQGLLFRSVPGDPTNARIHRPARADWIVPRDRGRPSQTRLPPANFLCPFGATQFPHRHHHLESTASTGNARKNR